MILSAVASLIRPEVHSPILGRFNITPEVPPSTGLHTIVGSSWLPAWFLSELAPTLQRGTHLHWIDVGNRFDAYGFSRTARDLGISPQRALAQIQLARPFNAYQLETMLREKIPASWKGQPIVLSDPMAPFLDEDLPIAEARELMRRTLAAMRRLPALWLILAVERKMAPERERLFEELVRESDRSMRLSQDGPMSLQGLNLPLPA
jgi:hypothetical protein